LADVLELIMSTDGRRSEGFPFRDPRPSTISTFLFHLYPPGAIAAKTDVRFCNSVVEQIDETISGPGHLCRLEDGPPSVSNVGRSATTPK